MDKVKKTYGNARISKTNLNICWLLELPNFLKGVASEI